MVLERTGYERERVAFVGDRIYTDVATGVKNVRKVFWYYPVRQKKKI